MFNRDESLGAQPASTSGNGQGGRRMGTIADLLQYGDGGGLSKELIKPGADPFELSMRTFIEDSNERRDILETWAKAKKYRVKPALELLAMFEGLATSIAGRGRYEYLQAITGVLNPQAAGAPRGRMKQGPRLKPEEERSE